MPVVTEVCCLPSQVRADRIAFTKIDFIDALLASFKKRGTYEFRSCVRRPAATQALFVNRAEKLRV